MKVLHITNWFPSKKSPLEGIFIEQHIKALDEYCDNQVFHFEISISRRFKRITSKSEKLKQLILQTPVSQWVIIEFFYFLWLFKFLVIDKRHKNYDIINFHIAYPMLTYWHLIKRQIQKPIIITEHWSAYKRNFGLKKDLPRVKKIFCQKIPVLAVSQVLIKDIKTFSACDFKSFVIPNVVDSKIFYPSLSKKTHRNTFLMCSFWKSPKRPLIALEAFKKSSKLNPEIQLKIIGNGPLLAGMQHWISENQLENKIELLGSKRNDEVAEIMRNSDFFLHPSDYETFSVVCAEALASGLQIIASNVGGIPEVLNDYGLLVENEVDSWVDAMNQMLNSENANFNFKANPYDPVFIGKKYFDVIKSVIDEAN